VIGYDAPLERRLQLRELKQSFVFNTLLAKKTRVGCAAAEAVRCGFVALRQGIHAAMRLLGSVCTPVVTTPSPCAP
jgi:hypothetical protein